MEAVTFNIKDGYLEGLVRGHKGVLLTTSQYNSLQQCETLDDIKLFLTGTDYGPYLINEAPPLHTTAIVDACTRRLADVWSTMRANADTPLSTFLDFCTYGHMIDNVVLIVTGLTHERDVQELTEKCHPLGVFDNMERLAVAANMSELYDLVLRDTPLGPYFSASLSSDDLDEMNLEIMRNTLYKAYLNDFAQFCQEVGGATAEIMGQMLQFEADRRALNITLNSINTEVSRDEKRKLYSDLGLLYPQGHQELAMAEDFDQIKVAMEKVPEYAPIFAKLGDGEGQMLDKLLYEEEVKRSKDCYDQQFHYGVFYAFMRLAEQEIRDRKSVV